MHPTRRQLLIFGAMGAVMLYFPRQAFAADTDKRFVFVILRGGLDGLHAAVPYGDPNYESARQGLAIPTSRLLKVDSMFALHPSLRQIHGMVTAGEGRIIHAAATAYRERSHFDGQNVLETGAGLPFARDTGWLNAALAAMPQARKDGRRELAVGVANEMPLMLRGSAPSVNWSPSRLPDADTDTLARVMNLYKHTDLKLASALDAAASANGIALASDAMQPMANTGSSALKGISPLAKAAADFLKQPNGPVAAVLEITGWDTHYNQGLLQGQLSRVLVVLDESLGTLKREMGSAWASTVVVAATEFGRTVAMNGNNGTDHGTAAAAFLFGGALARGGTIADWPGLSSPALYQNRDLKPTMDVRAVLKGVLRDHMAVPASVLVQVFPDSANVKPLDGLVTA